MRRLLSLALFLLVTATARGYDFSGPEIFLPVVARVPGANNTQWRTDVIVTNRSETAVTEVSMILMPNGTEGLQHRLTLAPLQTVTLTDVIRETFSVQQPLVGTLWLGSSSDAVRISAHARVYNSGSPAGEFGQAIHGLPPEQLSRVSWLTGLNGTGGNRTNVGIANPNNETTFFSLTWYDKSGESHGSVQLSIAPWQVIQLNDIFNYLAMPYDEALTLRVRASKNNLYTYASVVRNDTGDAYTILGTGSDQD